MVAGRFRIVEQIGSGGFSVVYRAHQESMNRFVALKVLKSAASADEKTVERFRREALFASHLSHPNTIRLFDYGHTDDGMCYIAMEFLVGQDLADVVRLGRPMRLNRVWSILAQCCRSLAEAHRLGLVHRDLKPENIFLVKPLVKQDGADEFVKVLDFGVSKAIGNFANASARTMAPLTQKGTVFGTPLYMAPEQAMAQPITAAADVYGLGHIAFEMITGWAAYGDAGTAMDVMLKQINEPALELPEPWDQTPFSPLITKCTLKDPAQRIQDASKLLEHLLHDAFLPYMSEEAGARRTRALSRAPTLDGRAGLFDAPSPPEPSPETPAGIVPTKIAPTGIDGLAEETSPQSVEIFDDLEEDALTPPEERDEADIAFDTVLGYLAELGDSVPLELWTLARARVVPTQYIALADFVVEQAERYGIVRRRGHASESSSDLNSDSGQALSFTKPGFAEKLRDGFDRMVEPVRAHRDIATLLLDYDPTPRRARLHRVVEHLLRAEQPARAMRLLWEAGEEASAASELCDARDYYQRLGQIIDDLDAPARAESTAELDIQPAAVWVRLGELHAALGEQGAAQDALSRAVAPDAQAGAELRGRAFKTMGDLAVSQRRYEPARTHYRHARDSFREAKHPEAFVAAIGAMGHCALMDGKFGEASELLSLALNRSERLGNAILGARLGRFMAHVLMQGASFEQAGEHLRRSLVAFEQASSHREIAETLVELGDASFAAGKYEASRDYFSRALTVDEAHGAEFKDTLPMEPGDSDHTEYSEFAYAEPPQIGLSRALAALGELDAAAKYFEVSLAEALATGERLRQARIRFFLGDICLGRKDFSQADRHFQAVEQLAQKIGHTELWVDASIRRAYLAFDAGDAPDAYSQLGEAMQLAESLGDAGAELAVRAHVIYLQLLEHEFRARGTAFAPLVARSRKLDLPRARVLCQIFNADVHAARGDVDQARSLLAEVRLGAAELHDYALLLPLSRRERDLARRDAQNRGRTPAVPPPLPTHAPPTRGIAIGALVPPLTDARRIF
jgi:serine/threonine protein kinase/tetratricopeptide (TPR) repeat protein